MHAGIIEDAVWLGARVIETLERELAEDLSFGDGAIITEAVPPFAIYM